jgi:hypothetical protein
MPLGSVRTASRRLAQDGAATPLRGVLRIRLVTLKNDVGQVEWETAPVPKEGGALAFRAFSGRKGEATLWLDGRDLGTVPLGSADFDASRPPFRVCSRREDERTGRGVYLVEGPLPAGPARLTLRYRTGMSLDPLYFIPDLDAREEDLAASLAGCAPRGALVPAVRVLDRSGEVYPDTFRSWIRVALGHAFAEPEGETPFRWSVAEVY